MSDAAFWDARYAARPTLWGSAPNRFLAEAFAEVRPWGSGRALDLACGEGRNAVWLAERGWRVTGVDVSRVALERARRLAEKRSVAAEWVLADALAWRAPEPFALVVVAYFHPGADRLQRLAESVAAALEPAGEAFWVGHALRNLRDGVGGPRDAALLWDPDEVARALRSAGLAVLRSEEVLRPVKGEGVAIDALLRARRGGP